MSYLWSQNCFAWYLLEKIWDWILSLCNVFKLLVLVSISNQDLHSKKFGVSFLFFLVEHQRWLLDLLKSDIRSTHSSISKTLFTCRIDKTQLGSVIEFFYITINNWILVLHLRYLDREKPWKTLLSQDFHHLQFNKKNIHIFHWKMGPHLKVSEIFRIATSFRKSKKNCNPGISINSLTKKIHHATPDRPLSRRDLRKVSFSTSPDPRSWAWLLWSQKTSPQIGSAARMTTSPWRKKQKKTYPAITPENFPFGRCWTNHRYIYI